MPNEANKSKKKEGADQKKKKPTMPVSDKQKTEGGDAKDTRASNNQKGASAGSAKATSRNAAGDKAND